MAIHIKPSHRGLFTKKAKAAGKGVQEFASEKAHSSNPTLAKEANFARMAKRHFKPLSGGKKKKSRFRRLAKAMA